MNQAIIFVPASSWAFLASKICSFFFSFFFSFRAKILSGSAIIFTTFTVWKKVGT